MKDLDRIMRSYNPMELTNFSNRHYILKLSFFGSIIHGTFKSTSDLDILVEFDPTHYPSLFDMVEMEEELAIIFQVPKVDLRTAHDLSYYFRSEVINEAKTIYDGRKHIPLVIDEEDHIAEIGQIKSEEYRAFIKKKKN